MNLVKRATILSLILFLSFYTNVYNQEDLLFTDNFENGLDQWLFYEMTKMEPILSNNFWVDSEDKEHGMVLSLEAGKMIGLIKDSESWNKFSIEGDLYFPESSASLMGLIYNFNLIPRPNWNGEKYKLRTEFGSVYVKCGGSYIRVNPHYDGTAGRALYDEFKTLLTGDAEIRVREWKRFKYEIVGEKCHIYIDNMEVPKLTFEGYHYSDGRIGFRPRSAGSECWIDNVKVRKINALSYKELVVPADVTWEPNKLVTDWESIGPFSNSVQELEKSRIFENQNYIIDGQQYSWEPFSTDFRGCVISGKICDFNEPKRQKSYFRTLFHSKSESKSNLKFSSRSNLTVFVNGKYTGEIKKVDHIWPDFWKKKRHEATELEVSFNSGNNLITVLVDGGKYPGCGFYLHIDE